MLCIKTRRTNTKIRFVSTGGGSLAARMAMFGGCNTGAKKTTNMPTKSNAAKKPSPAASNGGYSNGVKASYSQQSNNVIPAKKIGGFANQVNDKQINDKILNN